MANMISGNNLEMLEEYSKEKKIIEDNPQNTINNLSQELMSKFYNVFDFMLGSSNNTWKDMSKDSINKVVTALAKSASNVIISSFEIIDNCYKDVYSSLNSELNNYKDNIIKYNAENKKKKKAELNLNTLKASVKDDNLDKGSV